MKIPAPTVKPVKKNSRIGEFIFYAVILILPTAFIIHKCNSNQESIVVIQKIDSSNYTPRLKQDPIELPIKTSINWDSHNAWWTTHQIIDSIKDAKIRFLESLVQYHQNELTEDSILLEYTLYRTEKDRLNNLIK